MKPIISKADRADADSSRARFEATLKGYRNQVLAGTAAFETESRDAGPGLFLHLADPAKEVVVDLIYLGATPPSPVARIGDVHRGEPGPGEWAALITIAADGELADAFFGVSGLVRLRALRGGLLGGSFSLLAKSGPIAASDHRTLAAVGEFRAAPAKDRLSLSGARLSWGWDLSDLGLTLDNLGLQSVGLRREA